MAAESKRIMESETGTISTTELKQLLILLSDNPGANVCVRIRLMGEMWRPNFMRVLMLTANGVILNDEVEGRVYSIAHLSNIMQFELDGKIRGYEPNFHYNVENVKIE
jgi:hypothetical protein